PTTITNLWVGHTYEIEEVSGEGYSVSYEGKEVTITEGQASSVTVTNTFERDTGSMRIFSICMKNYLYLIRNYY
ncbi:MAG: hypothetical protein FWF15_07495, partial [Oscillospiraceae bacterium]|nr:hypothetical protein [Oscillospiraceae bacterium]